MNVGIITDAFPPTVGGIETFAGEYVKQLASQPSINQVDLLAFQPGPEEQSEDLTIQRSGANGSFDRFRVGLAWLREGKYDILHSMTLYQSGFIAALANTLGIVDRGFVTVYGTDALGVASHPVHRRIRRFTFRNLDEVLFFSDSTRKKTHLAYDLDFDSRTIYPGRPGLSIPTNDVDTPDTDGSFTVITVARLVERKGIDDLVEAVEPLSDVSLWIAGDGPEKDRLRQEVERKGMSDRVCFLGEVDHDQIAGYYTEADVFCLPSVYLEDEGDIEGLGLVFLEAQQLGVPAIGTKSGGIPEAIDEGKSGYLIEEQSPGEIRESLRLLKNDPETHHEFSENASELINRKFSWERCVDAHLDTYHG